MVQVRIGLDYFIMYWLILNPTNQAPLILKNKDEIIAHVQKSKYDGYTRPRYIYHCKGAAMSERPTSMEDLIYCWEHGWKVVKRESGCWEWTGGKKKSFYWRTKS